MVMKIMYPYTSWLVAAAYNILQTLEGVGSTSSLYPITNNPTHYLGGFLITTAPALSLIIGALVIYFLLLSCAFCVAGYCLAKKKGLFIAGFILVLPCLLHAFNAWPVINIIPDEYVVDGIGVLGSSVGMTSLASLGLVSGWVVMVLSTDFFNLQDRFRHLYDHLWYSMAVVGGIFFVSDVGTSQEQRALDTSVRHMQQASSYFLYEVQRYYSVCQSAGMVETVSCQWASDVQQRLVEYATYDERLFWQLGPKSSAELYGPINQVSQEVVDKIRIELQNYNTIFCPVTPNKFSRPSATCQVPPSDFCVSAEKSDGQNITVPYHTVAIANACIVPTLVKLRERIEHKVIKSKASAKSKHVRWMFYVLFAMLAGGKVANATARLTKGGSNQGLGDQLRLRTLFFNLRCGLGRFSTLLWQWVRQFSIRKRKILQDFTRFSRRLIRSKLKRRERYKSNL